MLVDYSLYNDIEVGYYDNQHRDGVIYFRNKEETYIDKIEFTGVNGFTGGIDYFTRYGTIGMGSCMYPVVRFSTDTGGMGLRNGRQIDMLKLGHWNFCVSSGNHVYVTGVPGTKCP